MKRIEMTLYQEDSDDDGLSDTADDDDDNDGIEDEDDLDDDGDGISDLFARFFGAFDWTVDTDRDGLPDHLDPDDDNDGIPDHKGFSFCIFKYSVTKQPSCELVDIMRLGSLAGWDERCRSKFLSSM